MPAFPEKADALLTLEHARQLTADGYELVLSGDTSAVRAPGQFVNLLLPGKFLRRPISICAWSQDALILLVRVVGEGTKALVRSVPGTEFPALVGLGNGFDLSRAGEKPVLVGGGVGCAPLYALAKLLCAAGTPPTVVLGFRTAQDALYLAEFAALGCQLLVTTEDGSFGAKGFVTDALRRVEGATFLYACGPTPMLRALSAAPNLPGGQFSLEARMGCGFGACMGCTIETKGGPRRVCADGPVFAKEELVW